MHVLGSLYVFKADFVLESNWQTASGRFRTGRRTGRQLQPGSKVQPSTRLVIEPRDSWLAVRHLTNCANLAHTLQQSHASVICCNKVFNIRPDQLTFREQGYFSKFEGSVGQKKRKIKKNPQFFALALIINKKLSLV